MLAGARGGAIAPELDDLGPAAAPRGGVLDFGWLFAALDAGGFREGLLAVVNEGGDADVRGALYGQLAGALYGLGAIPKGWRAALLRRELLEDTADRLLVAALAPAA